MVDAVELHVDFARHHDGIIDRIGPMIPRAGSRSELEDAEDGAVVERCAGFAQPCIFVAGVVDGKALARPDDG